MPTSVPCTVSLCFVTRGSCQCTATLQFRWVFCLQSSRPKSIRGDFSGTTKKCGGSSQGFTLDCERR